MSSRYRGVNLGGWLVLERWMSPSVFTGTDAKDEYSLCKALGPTESEKRLLVHRDAFITEAHMKQVAELGLTLVRLPVGYWLFGGEEPFVSGGDEYVDKVFAWAERYGLSVILDFHAAPGSQNGWDHSGRSGEIRWSEQGNVEKSLSFLKRLTAVYGSKPALVGIEPLNEPHWDVDLSVLVEYYRQAEMIIRSNCHAGVRTIVSDAFRPEEMSKALRRTQIDAMLDVHLYQLFTSEDRALDLPGHLRKAEKEWTKLLKRLTKHHKVLVGEWSGAMSELYHHQGEPRRLFTPEDYRCYTHIQQLTFTEQDVWWTYWTARTEDGGIWSLLDHPYLLT